MKFATKKAAPLTEITFTAERRLMDNAFPGVIPEGITTVRIELIDTYAVRAELARKLRDRIIEDCEEMTAALPPGALRDRLHGTFRPTIWQRLKRAFRRR